MSEGRPAGAAVDLGASGGAWEYSALARQARDEGYQRLLEVVRSREKRVAARQSSGVAFPAHKTPHHHAHPGHVRPSAPDPAKWGRRGP